MRDLAADLATLPCKLLLCPKSLSIPYPLKYANTEHVLQCQWAASDLKL